MSLDLHEKKQSKVSVVVHSYELQVKRSYFYSYIAKLYHFLANVVSEENWMTFSETLSTKMRMF
jgi:hypothetical protein